MQDLVAAILGEQMHVALVSARARSCRRIPFPAQKAVHLGRLPKAFGLNLGVKPDQKKSVHMGTECPQHIICCL